MNLFCFACGFNHEFKPSEAELLFYTLQASLAESRCEEATGKIIENEFDCLNDVLRLAYDPECFLEFCEDQVAARRYHEAAEER